MKFGLILIFTVNYRKHRKGFSLIESLILIVIAALMIGGILEVSAYTTNLQIAGRGYVDSYKAAASWFSALESVDAASIVSDFSNAVKKANQLIGAGSIYITNPRMASTAGVVVVSIDVAENKSSIKQIGRSFNVYSNETVPDK